MTCCPDVLQHLSFCRFSVKIRTVNENNPFMRHNGIRVIFLDGERALQAEAVWIRRGRSVAVCRALIREKGSEKALAEGEFSFFCLDDGSEKM